MGGVGIFLHLFLEMFNFPFFVCHSQTIIIIIYLWWCWRELSKCFDHFARWVIEKCWRLKMLRKEIHRDSLKAYRAFWYSEDFRVFYVCFLIDFYFYPVQVNFVFFRESLISFEAVCVVGRGGGMIHNCATSPVNKAFFFLKPHKVPAENSN